MRSLHLHIIKALLILAFTSVAGYGQTIVEDYNNGSINQREDECWIYSNFEINSKNPVNTAVTERKHGATVDMDYFGSVFSPSTWVSVSSMTTPFEYFDGSGSVSFKHKADNESATYLFSQLDLYLIEPDGTATTLFTHIYKSFGFQINGDPTVVQSEAISLPQGYYRLKWEWSDATSWTEFYIDDISIDVDTNSVLEKDTACFDAVAQHTPIDAVTDGAPYNFEYTWSWVGTTGGTLSTQTTNDRTAQVDWNVGPGTYRLKAVETYDNGNCNGRTFLIDVTVLDQPDFAIGLDTVCQGYQPTMTFQGLVGKAPFTVFYNDGGGSLSFTTNGSSESVLLSVDASSVSITDVVDDNGCHADAALLVAYPIYHHPKPSTGLIYHQ